MKIKINSPRVIRVDPDTYQKLKTTKANKITTTGVLPNDKVIIKEHDGTRYTGHEIRAVVKDTSTDQCTIQKLSITYTKLD